MGATSAAQQVFVTHGDPSLEGGSTEVRLSLVRPESAGQVDQAETLADYVWALAPGDTCFACGQGKLEAALVSVNRPQDASVSGEKLVCSVCGAEVGEREAA